MRKKVDDGWLLKSVEVFGEDSIDYFIFCCGKCGYDMEITVEDVDTVGFLFSTHCPKCGNKIKHLKVKANFSKELAPHVRARFDEKL